MKHVSYLVPVRCGKLQLVHKPNCLPGRVFVETLQEISMLVDAGGMPQFHLLDSLQLVRSPMPRWLQSQTGFTML